LVARKIGEKNERAVQSYGITALILAGVIGISISLIAVIFSKQIISIYDPDPSLAVLIKKYVDIIFAFTFVVFLNTTLRSIIQSTGNTKGPLYIFGTANIINIVLDYVFIIVLDFGIRGAASATVLSQSFACVMMMGLLYKQLFKDRHEFFRLFSVRLKEMKDILSIGIWACVQSIARPITGLIMMRIVYSVGGQSGSAAFGIGLNVINYFFIILTGLSGAISILVGQKIGEGNIDEAKEIVNEGIRYTVFNLILFSIPYLFLTEVLFIPFNTTPEVTAMGVNYVRIVFLGFIVLGHVFICRGAFAGAGDTYPPMVAALFANVLCKLTLAVLFTSVFGFGINGVWIAILMSIYTEWFVITRYYRKGKLYKNTIG